MSLGDLDADIQAPSPAPPPTQSAHVASRVPGITFATCVRCSRPTSQPHRHGGVQSMVRGLTIQHQIGQMTQIDVAQIVKNGQELDEEKVRPSRPSPRTAGGWLWRVSCVSCARAVA